MVQVECMIQKDGGECESLTRSFPAVPRIGERVELLGPEFGEESDGTAWKGKDGVFEGLGIFRVWDVCWSERGAEVYLAPEPQEHAVALWCACTPEERKRFEADPARPGECANCGRKQR